MNFFKNVEVKASHPPVYLVFYYLLLFLYIFIKIQSHRCPPSCSSLHPLPSLESELLKIILTGAHPSTKNYRQQMTAK